MESSQVLLPVALLRLLLCVLLPVTLLRLLFVAAWRFFLTLVWLVWLAKGYDEAVDVAVSIIDEVFHETGAFEVAAYLKAKSRGRRTVT